METNIPDCEKILSVLIEYDLEATSLQEIKYARFKVRCTEKPTIKLETPKGTVVLEKIANYLFEARFIVATIKKLEQAGVAVPKLWTKRHARADDIDSYIIQVRDQFFVLQSFILGKEIDRLKATPENFWSIGFTLGRIHEEFGVQSKKTLGAPITNIIHAKQNIMELKDTLQSMNSSELNKSDLLFLANADHLLINWEVLEKRLPESWYLSLPHYVVHNDLSFPNLLFNDSGDIVAILDWERLGIAPRLVDFRNPVLNTRWQRVYDKEALINLAAAYQRCSAIPLSKEELQALPEKLRATFLWEFGAKFLLQRDQLEIQENYAAVFEELKVFEHFWKDFPGSEQSEREFIDTVEERMPQVFF